MGFFDLSQILKELRLMGRQSTYKFTLMCFVVIMWLSFMILMLLIGSGMVLSKI